MSHLFNVVLDLLANAIRQEEKNKIWNTGKETAKLLLFANDMIIYLETQRELTEKLLETIRKFSKAKLIQKLTASVYQMICFNI